MREAFNGNTSAGRYNVEAVCIIMQFSEAQNVKGSAWKNREEK